MIGPISQMRLNGLQRWLWPAPLAIFVILCVHMNFNHRSDSNISASRLEKCPNANFKSLLNLMESNHPCLAMLHKIFLLEVKRGQLSVPPVFSHTVQEWLGHNPALYQEFQYQTVVVLTHRFTHMTTVFNPLRQSRPRPKSVGDPLTQAQLIVEQSRPGCNFCSFRNLTAEDTFGRLETKWVVTAANAFKLSDFHALVIPKIHSPLKLTGEMFFEALQVARQWFEKVHDLHPQSTHPHIIMDLMPHAGTSQVHPHFHVFMGSHHYLGQFGLLQAASTIYEKSSPSASLLDDFVQMHMNLGLGLKLGHVFVIVPLDAHKDHEVMIVGPEFHEKDLTQALTIVYQAYLTVLGVFCFSSGLAGPPLSREESNPRSLPVVWRIGSRGNCLSPMSDVSSLELYMMFNVNTNPYHTFEAIQSVTQKLSSPVEFQ